jgi:hypothetical protein
MAWSVHFIGRPDAIKRALIAYGQNLYGDARAEFRMARPVLEELVGLNTGDDVLSLNASGGSHDEHRQAVQGVTVILMRSSATHVQ